MSMVHEAICRLLDEDKKGLLLDAASGEGILSVPLSERGFKVIACDLYRWGDSTVPFVNADLNRPLPFKDSFKALFFEKRLFSELQTLQGYKEPPKVGFVYIQHHILCGYLLSVKGKWFEIKQCYCLIFKIQRVAICDCTEGALLYRDNI